MKNVPGRTLEDAVVSTNAAFGLVSDSRYPYLFPDLFELLSSRYYNLQ
jgi:hypothetical protein